MNPFIPSFSWSICTSLLSHHCWSVSSSLHSSICSPFHLFHPSVCPSISFFIDPNIYLWSTLQSLCLSIYPFFPPVTPSIRLFFHLSVSPAIFQYFNLSVPTLICLFSILSFIHLSLHEDCLYNPLFINLFNITIIYLSFPKIKQKNIF